MPSSMTGFGRGHAVLEGRELSVEVRSVNHRYLEVRSAPPAELASLGPDIERMIRERFSRGRFDVHVTLVRAAGGGRAHIDAELAEGYFRAFEALAVHLGLEAQVDLRLVLEAPGVVQNAESSALGEAVVAALRTALVEALVELTAMRETEGAHLGTLLRAHLVEVRRLILALEERVAGASEQRRHRLEARIDELTQGVGVDPGRLAQEVALLVDRSDVTEELERLEAHRIHGEGLLASDGPVGRKLDFLVQEMNRETNTVGAKCADTAMAHHVVELKAELERMREQIQNLE